jgi:hypothetical protein
MAMSPISISAIVFACVFGGVLLGTFLRAVLPQHHLSVESKDILKLGMGLVGTMAALVLGLLVASAKGYYDVQPAPAGDVRRAAARGLARGVHLHPASGELHRGTQIIANIIRRLVSPPLTLTGVPAEIARNRDALAPGVVVPSAVDSMSPWHPFIRVR